MRNIDRRGHHGKNVETILNEYHEMMVKEFCHGNDSDVDV